jgi:Zn-dependent protease
MIRSTLTLATISGIPIKIHLNWFLIAILVTWSLAGGYFPQNHPGGEAVHYWIFGTITALLFFSSVLFHELGHALVALNEGVPVKSITLFMFGGVAHIAHEPETPEAEFRIVAAGPFASLILAAFFFAFSATPLLGSETRSAGLYLSQINLILALFNLIPGFPLDGGRLLRAALWKSCGDFDRATHWAMVAGLGVAGLFVTGGLAFVILDNLFNGLWLAFIGWYLGRSAIQHYRQNQAQDTSTLSGVLRKHPGSPSGPGSKAGAPTYGLSPALIFVEPDGHEEELDEG